MVEDTNRDAEIERIRVVLTTARVRPERSGALLGHRIHFNVIKVVRLNVRHLEAGKPPSPADLILFPPQSASVNGLRRKILGWISYSQSRGGPGTYSQALILEHIEDILKKLDAVDSTVPNLIRDHFDLIGGVGFGGLLAIMLGRLGMTAAQARDGLLQVAQAVFPPGVMEQFTPESRSQRLRKAIEGVAQEKGLPIDAMLHDNRAKKPACIVVVYAVTSNNDQQAHALRTYETKVSPLNPTIVEAACATISIPSFFAPVVVGPPMLRLSFAGGPKDYMNPALRLLDQSRALLGPEKDKISLISIGCGRPLPKLQSGPSNSSQHNQYYESMNSGMFLDILSPVKMVRGSLNKRRAKKAQSSNVASNAGWHVADDMSNDCLETEKKVMARFVGSVGYMRLNVEKEMTVLNHDDWTDLGSVLGHTRTYLEKLKLASDIPRLLETSKPKKPLRSTPKAPPRVSPSFVPRSMAYATMRHYLINDRTTYQKIMVITGMGGCGKTQIVSYFLRENDSFYPHVIYVDASSEGSIKTDLEAWIQSIKGHEEEDWQGALTYIRHGLRNKNWILVLDNSDDIKVKITPFFPPCNRGTVVVTSRNRDRGNLATTAHIELGIMTPEESMDVLLLSAKRRTPLASEEDVAAQNLLAKLGHLPLAVSLAGSYCRQLSSSVASPYTFGQYLDVFHSKRSRLMDRQQVDPLDQYQQSINTTISLSYSRLSDSEKEYFDLFATFDGTDISLEIFSEAAKNQFKDRKSWMPRAAEHEETLEQLRAMFLVDQKWDGQDVETAIVTLTSNSLLSTISVASTMHIHIHPLVQAWACDRRDQAQSSRYTLMAAQVLTACKTNQNLRLGRAMLPHIQLLMTAEKIAGLHINSRMAFALTLQGRSYQDLAAKIFGAAYEELKGTVGSEELVTLEAAELLAYIRHDQGQHEDSRRIHAMIWERRKEILGRDHLDTLRSAENLASTYWSLSRYKDALELQLEVWEKRKEILGADHTDTLTSAGKLALTYGELRRFKEALQLQLEVWEKRKEKWGADNPSTLFAANQLARRYKSLSRLDDALHLHLEVWEKRKEILGMDHPATLVSGYHLAHMYWLLNRHEEAEVLQLEVLEKQKEILGSEHPTTLWSHFNLACIYCTYKQEQAFELFREVLTLQTKTVGPQHRDTLYMIKMASDYGFSMGDQPD